MYNGFSILIPTWNNLDYLKLCVRSIRQHSAYNHQIIIHVNDGSDGTLEWVKAEGLDYTHSEENIGVCLAMNSMRRLVNYGDSIQTFEEERLLKEYMNTPYNDWLGATRPPSLVHRDIWDLVGGYSIEFSPGMYSDPDFTAKLLMVGVTHMKGLGNSRVYHFETKTTGRIRKNDGSTQFLLKWGISNSTMRKHITRQGQDWSLHDTPINKAEIAKKKRFVRAKALWYILKNGFGIAKDLGEI